MQVHLKSTNLPHLFKKGMSVVMSELRVKEVVTDANPQIIALMNKP